MQAGRFAPRMLAVGTVVAGALAGFTSGCSPDLTPSKPPANSVTVHVLNLASSAGALGVQDSTLHGSLKSIFSGVGYLGDYKAMANEGGTWYVFSAGSKRIGVAGSAEFLATYSYDVFITDSGAGPTYSTQELPTVEPDTVSTNTKIRVVNLLPTPAFPYSDTAGYEVWVNPPGTPLTSTAPAVVGLTFGLNTSINSGPTYMDETPGPTEVVLTDSTGVNVIIDSTMTLNAGQALTMFAVPSPGNASAAQFFIVRDH